MQPPGCDEKIAQLYQHRLVDPNLPEDANQLVYVGITRRSWKVRWQEHLAAAVKRFPHLRLPRSLSRWHRHTFACYGHALAHPR